MTGQELVQGALGMIGAWGPADGPVDAADLETALFHANLLRKSWNIKPLALHAITRATYTWPSATSSRTIGAAGQLVGPRPAEILFAKVIPAGSTSETDVHLISHGEYAAIPDKTQTGDYFSDLLYERTGSAVGTLTVWPVPTTAPTLVLHCKVLLDAITAGATITAPEGYDAALVSQLAKRCAPVFSKAWTRELEELATEDLAAVKRANIRVPDVTPLRGLPGVARGVSQSGYDAGTV